ncbi:hypothetical protein RvY_03029 [Ramazzottius varieornatus]|uniref:Uncharacterized protein n=1 Tax=Ramazzottius varieornatus TaxID=947166 RepID=A0A1D1UQ50_RAMVA|nr:hypothetical protein RvY_03029 [Ramazzottius varieornatus]
MGIRLNVSQTSRLIQTLDATTLAYRSLTIEQHTYSWGSGKGDCHDPEALPCSCRKLADQLDQAKQLFDHRDNPPINRNERWQRQLCFLRHNPKSHDID